MNINGQVIGLIDIGGNLAGEVNVTCVGAEGCCGGTGSCLPATGRLGGTLHVGGLFTGRISANDGLVGTVDVDGGGQSTGTISVTGDVECIDCAGGNVFIAGSYSGDMHITGDMIADSLIDIAGEHKYGSVIDIDGDLLGKIEMDDMDGDINVDGAVQTTSTQAVLVRGEMKSRARILSDGLIDAIIEITEGTANGSLIASRASLDDDGAIIINSGDGPYDAAGDIIFGTGGYPAAVQFDGHICIAEQNSSTGGVLTGDLLVQGCDNDDSNQLDICIENGVVGSSIVNNVGCTNTPGATCSSACP